MIMLITKKKLNRILVERELEVIEHVEAMIDRAKSRETVARVVRPRPRTNNVFHLPDRT